MAPVDSSPPLSLPPEELAPPESVVGSVPELELLPVSATTPVEASPLSALSGGVVPEVEAEPEAEAESPAPLADAVAVGCGVDPVLVPVPSVSVPLPEPSPSNAQPMDKTHKNDRGIVRRIIGSLGRLVPRAGRFGSRKLQRHL